MLWRVLVGWGGWIVGGGVVLRGVVCGGGCVEEGAVSWRGLCRGGGCVETLCPCSVPGHEASMLAFTPASVKAAACVRPTC